MNTPSGITNVLGNVPGFLRTPLLRAFSNIVNNYIEQRWEPSELNGGKLCEVVYSILEGHITGTFPAKPKKPKNFVDACRQLENSSSSALPRSVRIQIPRIIIALYEIRNSRGVGHITGDVNPNHMDAMLVLNMSKWLMAELVRLYHNVSTAQATGIVDSLVEKTMPIIWCIGKTRRVLDVKLNTQESTLILLYESNSSVSENDLCKWVEYSNPSRYRQILIKLHKKRLVEYDKKTQVVYLSPLGSKYVEDSVLSKYKN